MILWFCSVPLSLRTPTTRKTAPLVATHAGSLAYGFARSEECPPSFLTDRLEAPHSVAPPPEIPPLHGLRRRGIEDHDPAQRGQEGHRKRSEPEQPSEEWRREKGTSLTSTVSEGKEPMGHARKRLMQAA